MFKLLGHKCGQTELKCFDCRKPICRDCLIELPNSLVCRKCKPRKKALKSIKVNDVVRLEAASVSYSFIAFAMLSYVGGSMLGLLFAAIFGVVIAEGLNKLDVSAMSRKSQLIFVVSGVLIGAILGCGMRLAVQGEWEKAIFSILPQCISVVIVLIAIFVRFRTY